MEQLKEIIRDNWIEILLLVLGYLFGFVTSYLKERVKNKALLADINALEEEKKIHHLDIEKRKYKYEDKRAQFTKYFNLIDNMAVVSNEELITKFLPLITTYQEEFLGANEDRDKEVAALNKFSKGIGEFTFKSNDNIMRIRTETNGIRLA